MNSLITKKYFNPKAIISVVVGLFLVATSLSPLLNASSSKDLSSEIVLVSNQTNDPLKKMIAESIRASKKSIFLLIYSLSDYEIIHALNERAEKGVKIVVVHDPETPQLGFQKLHKNIKKIALESQGLMHKKILIIDDKKIWLGSANFTYESLKHHDNLVFLFDCPELANFITNRHKYVQNTKSPLNAAPFTYNYKNLNPLQSIEYWSLPEDRQLALERLYEKIDQAKKTLKIAMFTWTHMGLAERVLEAHKRGVKVEVVIDRQSAEGASKNVFNKLRAAKISVGVHRGSEIFHHKFMLIDDSILVNGSTNWTQGAFTKNHDCFLILAPLNEIQFKKMNSLWKVIRANKI